jgi:hypothetical protein
MPDIKLLAAIRSIFEWTGEDRITTWRLLEALAAIEDGPWALMFEDSLRHGNQQSAAAKLARLLKEYKTPEGKRLKPHTIRMGDETPKGFYRSDFELEWKRYLPSPLETPQQAQQVQHTTENEHTTEDVAPNVVAPVNGQAATEISLAKEPNVAAVATVPPDTEGVRQRLTEPERPECFIGQDGRPCLRWSDGSWAFGDEYLEPDTNQSDQYDKF